LKTFLYWCNAAVIVVTIGINDDDDDPDDDDNDKEQGDVGFCMALVCVP